MRLVAFICAHQSQNVPVSAHSLGAYVMSLQLDAVASYSCQVGRYSLPYFYIDFLHIYIYLYIFVLNCS